MRNTLRCNKQGCPWGVVTQRPIESYLDADGSYYCNEHVRPPWRFDTDLSHYSLEDVAEKLALHSKLKLTSGILVVPNEALQTNEKTGKWNIGGMIND